MPDAARPAVAVVGANADRRKFGNKCVRAYLAAGYDVYPVHPVETAVEGQPSYRTIADIPAARLDRIAVYLPPAVGVRAVETFLAKPVGEVWLNPGADAPEVVARAAALGLNVVVGCAIVALGVSPRDFPDA